MYTAALGTTAPPVIVFLPTPLAPSHSPHASPKYQLPLACSHILCIPWSPPDPAKSGCMLHRSSSYIPLPHTPPRLPMDSICQRRAARAACLTYARCVCLPTCHRFSAYNCCCSSMLCQHDSGCDQACQHSHLPECACSMCFCIAAAAAVHYIKPHCFGRRGPQRGERPVGRHRLLQSHRRIPSCASASCWVRTTQLVSGISANDEGQAHMLKERNAVR
jgi:hypothetical protein